MGLNSFDLSSAGGNSISTRTKTTTPSTTRRTTITTFRTTRKPQQQPSNNGPSIVINDNSPIGGGGIIDRIKDIVLGLVGATVTGFMAFNVPVITPARKEDANFPAGPIRNLGGPGQLPLNAKNPFDRNRLQVRISIDR